MTLGQLFRSGMGTGTCGRGIKGGACVGNILRGAGQLIHNKRAVTGGVQASGTQDRIFCREGDRPMGTAPGQPSAVWGGVPSQVYSIGCPAEGRSERVRDSSRVGCRYSRPLRMVVGGRGQQRLGLDEGRPSSSSAPSSLRHSGSRVDSSKSSLCVPNWRITPGQGEEGAAHRLGQRINGGREAEKGVGRVNTAQGKGNRQEWT